MGETTATSDSVVLEVIREAPRKRATVYPAAYPSRGSLPQSPRNRANTPPPVGVGVGAGISAAGPVLALTSSMRRRHSLAPSSPRASPSHSPYVPPLLGSSPVSARSPRLDAPVAVAAADCQPLLPQRSPLSQVTTAADALRDVEDVSPRATEPSTTLLEKEQKQSLPERQPVQQALTAPANGVTAGKGSSGLPGLRRPPRSTQVSPVGRQSGGVGGVGGSRRTVTSSGVLQATGSPVGDGRQPRSRSRSPLSPKTRPLFSEDLGDLGNGKHVRLCRVVVGGAMEGGEKVYVPAAVWLVTVWRYVRVACCVDCGVGCRR